MSNKVWDYRVIRKESADGSTEWYSVQEVYYDDGQPMAQTTDLQVEGDTITEIRTRLEKMINCLGQPVLDEINSEWSVTKTNSEEDATNYYTKPETEDKYIYESPDGGNTIYRRKFGETTRENLKTDKKTTMKGLPHHYHLPAGTNYHGDGKYYSSWSREDEDITNEEIEASPQSLTDREVEKWRKKVKKRGGI